MIYYIDRCFSNRVPRDENSYCRKRFSGGPKFVCELKFVWQHSTLIIPSPIACNQLLLRSRNFLIL